MPADHAIPPPAQARVTVARQSPRDARQRQVYSSLDGEDLAMLMFGESATREVPPGRHVLKVNNTLVWKTYEFDVQPGEEVRISLVNYQARGFATMLAVLGVAILFLSIEREEPAR